ncbi:Rv1535 domain-containing protein [Mycobacterium pseudokansasii]|uniref:Rv1535 domain-containing protein n=1 Tax=Mycobacterium pseudokansasii TaxID=2341080 RepID=UPI001FCF08C0|nr:Rv1535 domain-containing protein [Mycobacterium pseudokansasii]
MSTTDALADPLVSSIAAVLSVPLRELYALLWRVGVVEIVERKPAAGPMDPVPHPYCPECGSERPSRRSRRRPTPGPAPTRPGRAGCSRAAG